MPERIFKYHTLEDLKKFIAALTQAMISGSTEELRNSSTGFLVKTGRITQADLRARIMEARYEIFLRGQGDENTAADAPCLALEPKNPLHEKVMCVETVRGGYLGSAFGFPTTPIP